MNTRSKSLSIAVAIFMTFISQLMASDGVTFASFNTGTITGAGTPFTKALDVSALPNTEYVFVSVTCDYAPGVAPHDGYSSTMKMEINNGSSTVYWPLSTATIGILPAGGATTLTWSGVLPKSYVGGGNLSVKFEDDFTDGSGPYTSALNNVVVKIYPAPTPKKTFASFNTGTITGAGTPFTKALDVSGLPNTEYLLVTVTGNYAPGVSPHDGFSSTMKMEINNGSSTVYWPLSTATIGILPADGATTLTWTGVLPKSYIGGGNLSVKFEDDFTDGNGPYTSALNNVSVTIYPAPTPKKTFSSFNTGTITGAGTPFTKALDVSGLPNTEYLLVAVTGDYAPGASPHDGYSSTMKMEINNGSSTVYWPLSTATLGVLPGAGATTLTWTGVLPKSYIGGGNLSIKFEDDFTDANGPYTSALNNVNATIYPVFSNPPSIASSLTAAGTYGSAICTYTIAANNSPTGYGASGLPSGLAINTANGQITGTPLTNGVFNVSIGATNSSGAGTATLVFTIGKAALTVSGVTANDKPYDGSTNATIDVSGAVFHGVVNGDSLTLDSSSATASFSSKNIGANKSVTISGLTFFGAGSANYTFTQPTATASITAKTLDVIGVTANNKVYNGTTNATINTGSAALSGVVNGDAVTLNSDTAAGAFTEPSWGWMNMVSTVGAFFMAAALIFVWNLGYSLIRGKLAGDNPWNAWRPEWATTSPPPHENFHELPPIRSRRPLWDTANPDRPDPLVGTKWKAEIAVPEKNKTGVIAFIFSEAGFFGVLILAYLYYNATPQPGPGAQDLNLLKTAFFSLCLFASSFTIWRSEVNLQRRKQRAMAGWLAATILLGGIFITGQAIEYHGLYRSGVEVSSNLFATTFFTLTGFHGLHFCVGLILLLVLLGLAFAGDFKTGHSPALKAVGLYWHFVDVVWVFVFFVVYILPRL